MPRVSIAVPAYNCERYVAQSLESLLGQTFGDFELVISDNASTDGTEAICREYAARDARVRYVRRTENIGGPGNFRYVFSLCRGAYHKWSTADDFWAPEYLQKCVDVLDRRPDAVLCYSKTRLVDADSAPIEDYEDNLDLQQESAYVRFRELYTRIGLCNAHLGLIRRSAMERTGLIAGHLASDYDFLAELALYGKFILLDERMFSRRFHEKSSSWSRGDTKHQQSYYDPQGLTKLADSKRQKYRFLRRAVRNAPVPLAQKAQLAVRILKMWHWDRAKLRA
jgi:glycosyltransferase involved in cell wall biosynthesis